MERKELDAKINNSIDGIYLFYGQNKYFMDQTISKIKKSFGDIIVGLNFIQLDASNVDSLIDNMEIPAFGFSKKLIIVKDSNLFPVSKKKKEDSEKEDAKEEKKNKKADQIAEYIDKHYEDIIETNIVIFVEEAVSNNKLFKTINEKGIVVEYKDLTPEESISYIKGIIKHFPVKMSDINIRYFVEVVGTDSFTINNELAKQVYCNLNGEITKKSIDTLATKNMESVIFDLTNAMGTKNAKQALEILDNLLSQKIDFVVILPFTYSTLKKIYYTKLAIKEKVPLAPLLDLKAGTAFLERKYKEQSSLFKESELRMILDELIRLDDNYKAGLIDPKIGFESIISRYCSK